MQALFLTSFAASRCYGVNGSEQSKRPVTVADVISMTRVADYISNRSVAHISPDGRKVIVILRKGNLLTNTNEYSLLLWQTAELFNRTLPEIVLRMSSSSSRGAMNDLKWLEDSETVSFLGEHTGELQQLYTFNIRSRELRKVTSHSSNVLGYSMSANGTHVAFLAGVPTQDLFDEAAARDGILVSTQFLGNLIAGRKGGTQSDGGENQVFVMSPPAPTRQIQLGEMFVPQSLSLSPDGKYVIVRTCVSDIPEIWRQYQDRILQTSIGKTFVRGQCYWVTRYTIVDTSTGVSRILLNSPVGTRGSEVLWAPDSKSIIVSDVFLPLNVQSPDERDLRSKSTYAVELEIPTGKLVSIVSDEDLLLLGWDTSGTQVAFEVGRANWRPGATVVFSKQDGNWKKLSNNATAHAGPRLELEEGLNNPPKIVAVDPDSQNRATILDLNPQFDQMEFAHVEQIRWKRSDGHEVAGGLYYPFGYTPGRKYPLVIQTHGFSPDQFWIDGPYPTAFAAQPLAAKGIMVLQADEGWDMDDTPNEVDREVSIFENAIDYLNSKGLIDPAHVGIIGFSRTCLFVKYALTHSHHRFAAASVTDGVDAGYFQYMTYANMYPDSAQFAESINGASPFGQGLEVWMKRAPGFSMDKVRTPLLIVAPNRFALLGDWEWFVGLSRLGMPVETVYMDTGIHLLQKPWDRKISLERNVDWFTFWLQDEVDSSPSKSAQYARWRELRAIQEGRLQGPAGKTGNFNVEAH